MIKELQQINYDDKIKLLKQQNDSFSAKKTLLDAKSGDESNISIPDFKNGLEKINIDISSNKEKIDYLEASNSDKGNRIKQLNENLNKFIVKLHIRSYTEKDERNRHSYFS